MTVTLDITVYRKVLPWTSVQVVQQPSFHTWDLKSTLDARILVSMICLNDGLNHCYFPLAIWLTTFYYQCLAADSKAAGSISTGVLNEFAWTYKARMCSIKVKRSISWPRNTRWHWNSMWIVSTSRLQTWAVLQRPLTWKKLDKWYTSVESEVT